MKCVVLQPSYIPWRGYFHLIRKADTFVFYDDVQYDRHGWRNRNRIKTPAGSRWLTIPLRSTGGRVKETPICEMQISREVKWAASHFETLRHNYSKAPYFSHYRCMLEDWYSEQPPLLADFTISTTVALAKELGISGTRFLRSSTLGCGGSKTARLLAVLRQVGATHYISGPSAKSYLDENAFEAAGISVEWMVYQYPEYSQLFPPFDSQVSALDLLLNAGPAAGRFIWGTE